MAKEVFGTKEWAKYSLNMTTGCSHNCRYCYSREAYERNDNEIPWTEERINEKVLHKKFGKRSGVTMFPTSHDITPNNYKEALTVLKNLLEPGNEVLIVSKPHIMVIDYLTKNLEEYKDKILFRFTIGSKDNEILKFWEPNAPLFEERFDSLKVAFERGFNTSVSAEPLLDNKVSSAVDLVLTLEPYISNSLWIGKMNKPDKRIIPEPGKEEFIRDYLNGFTDENVLKIYEALKDNPIIKWKESIKKVVGIKVPTEAGDKITGLPKDLKDINLSNYVFNGRIENGEVKDKLTRLKKEIEDIRFSFMRNIKEEFFKEMSKEFKIKETVIKEIVKSSLNRMALYSKLSN